MILPVAAVCALLPPLAGDRRTAFAYRERAAGPPRTSPSRSCAYALFVVAALQALVMTGLEKRLHRGLRGRRSATVPPLLTLERYMFRLIAVGFVLLTLTLASGIVFSEQLFGKPVTFTHKNVFSVARLARVRRAALRPLALWLARAHGADWILGGTLLLVLGYLGSKFVSKCSSADDRRRHASSCARAGIGRNCLSRSPSNLSRPLGRHFRLAR